MRNYHFLVHWHTQCVPPPQSNKWYLREFKTSTKYVIVIVHVHVHDEHTCTWATTSSSYYWDIRSLVPEKQQTKHIKFIYSPLHHHCHRPTIANNSDYIILVWSTDPQEAKPSPRGSSPVLLGLGLSSQRQPEQHQRRDWSGVPKPSPWGRGATGGWLCGSPGLKRERRGGPNAELGR